MPIKPLTHLRPLLRLPSHSSPEHFSSNPSLLHHLPPGGGGQSPVNAGNSSASAAGNAGSSGPSAGRAGWGSAGAGGGGGYTGHARAFLSLPQTGAIDPSGSIGASITDDNRATVSARASILLKHRLTKRTQLVGIESEGVGRSVHRQIEARASPSSRVRLVDIGTGESRDLDESRLLGDVSMEERARGQSAITFPSQIQSQSISTHEAIPMSSTYSTPSHSRSTTPVSTPPRRLRALPRSQSNLEMWHVGMPLPRQMPIRTLSTQSSTAPLLESEKHFDNAVEIVNRTPPPSTRTLLQPNRVLMDLAGLDLPGMSVQASRPRLGVRRNSTAAIQQTETETPRKTVEEDGDELEPTSAMEGSDERDLTLFKAIVHESRHGEIKPLHALISHYRQDRSTAETAPDMDPQLVKRYPLPPTFTSATYNACLRGLVECRRPGESIALILEIYNEMLERDCAPNRATYSTLIRALCYREQDVWRACKTWEDEKKWARWRAGTLGTEYNVTSEQEKDFAVEGYKAEGNFASALKLWRAARMLKGSKEWADLTVYRTLINACAARGQSIEDVQQMKQLVQHAQDSSARGFRILFGDLFEAMGATGDLEGLKEMWTKFQEEEAVETSDRSAQWIRTTARMDQTRLNLLLNATRKAVWRKAACAFIQAGDVEKGLEILEQMLLSSGTDTSPPKFSPTAYLLLDEELCVFIKTLALNGHVDQALEILEKNRPADVQPGNRVMSPNSYLDLFDALLLAGRWERALELVEPFSSGPETDMVRLSHERKTRLYAAILADASKLATTDQVKALTLLERIKSIISPKHTIPFAPDVFSAHVELAVALERPQDLPNIAECMFWQTQGELVPTITPILNALVTQVEMPLKTIIDLIKAFSELAGGRPTEDSIVPMTLGVQYLDARGKVSSAAELGLAPAQWVQLIRSLVLLSKDDGELDEAYIKLAQDLSELKQGQEEITKNWGRTTMLNIGKRLAFRFGKERAVQILAPAFGQKSADEWTELPPPTYREKASEDQSPSSILQDRTSTPEEFTLPPTPDTMSPSPSSPGTLSGYRIVRDLSIAVDNHTRRNAKVTELQAYDFVQNGLGNRQLAHPLSLGRLLENLARAGEEAKCREMYMLVQQITQSHIPPHARLSIWTSVENNMLIACCQMGHLEEAGMYRARLVQARQSPSADAYATMIASAKDTTDDALVARELFDESRAMGVRPNLFLYNTIISKLSRARKAEMALELFKAMKESHIKPSSVTYGAVINACCRVGDGESAATLFHEMASQPDFRPRVPPFNTMMQFHLTTQPSRERVLYYFNAMREAQVPPSAHTYKLLLDAYAVLPPVDLAAMDGVFRDLVADHQVGVSGTHWASLICAHGLYADDVARALSTFDSIPSVGPSAVDISSEPVVWEAILNVVAQKGTVSEMEAIRSRMESSGARATAYVYNVLISGYARDGDVEKARGVFESMGDSITGVAAPNNHPTLLTSSGHVKPSTVTGGPTPTVYREPSTYETMIRAELAAGTREGAETVCKRMEERRYPVAVFMRARALLDDQVMREQVIGTPAFEGQKVYKSNTPTPGTTVPVGSVRYDPQAKSNMDPNTQSLAPGFTPDAAQLVDFTGTAAKAGETVTRGETTASVSGRDSALQ